MRYIFPNICVNMVCPLCKGTTKDNQPCKRKTCKFAPMCFQHTSVEVKPSNIAGRGLFAKRDIRTGEIVGDYTIGTKQLTPGQFRAKYPNGRATHVWSPRGRGTYYDATDGSKSVAGKANRAPSGGRNNAKITGGGKLKAKQRITKGREILVGYGAGFRV